MNKSFAFLILGILSAVTAQAQTGSGKTGFVRHASAALDPYSNAPSTTQQQWFRDHFWRMNVFTPYFDNKLAWYQKADFYKDLYAIYTNSTVAMQHPEWILKDASGRKLYIPWGCSNGTCPQYAADVTNVAFRQWWINEAAATLGVGYNGIFVDDVNMEFRVGDGNGNFVAPMDPNTGVAMTATDWRRYIAEFTETIRAAFPNKEIVHNSIWFAGPAGVRDRDPYIQRQIKAANILYIEFGVEDGGLTGGTGDWSLASLLGYIDRVHALGRAVTISNAPVNPASNSEYSLANYYLISTGSDGIGNDRSTPDNWWSGFDTNIGDAKGPRFTWNGLLRRDFASGMVLVNPPQSATVTVALPGTWQRLDGTSVTSVTLGAKQGLVLRSTVQSGDQTPPTVAITSPASGTTVTSSVQVTASATDNVGVTRVEFYVDGVLAATSSAAPYGFSFSATSYSAGAHVVTAKAYDAANNTTTSSAITLTVQKPAVVSCPGPANGAFTGCYYTGTNLNTLVASRTDAAVNFDWGTGSPSAAVPADRFSAKWEGVFSFGSGKYSFTVVADDGVRLYIDGVLVLDKWLDQWTTTYSVVRNMSSGPHTIKLVYYENGGTAVAKLSWNRR